MLVEQADEPASYTRLHITPFDESLFSVVVPSSVRPLARNISYHTLQTFPDKPYGFIELPTGDAERLRKKLNSAVLRGHKLRIETARPIAQKPSPVSTKESTAVASARGLRKRKREQGVIAGTEIQGRKIKRGWTTSEAEMIQKKRERSGKSKEGKKDKKDGMVSIKKTKKGETKKSKFTDAPECLFKARLPSKSEPVPVVEPQHEGEEASTAPKKKKRRTERDAIIHEFEKSTKFPSFLKVNSSVKSVAEAVTFEDGKGWVDSNGAVVESAKSTRPPTAGIIPAKSKRAKKENRVKVAMPVQTLDDTTSDDSSSSEDEEPQTTDGEADAPRDDPDDNTTSSEGEDSDSSASEQDTTDSKAVQPRDRITPRMLDLCEASATSAQKPENARPRSSGSVNNLTIKIPPATPAPAKVHPLEALYKRPQGGASTPNAQESKGFSFFDNDNNDDIEEEDATTTLQTLQVPMTPFTERDFEFRTMRSAAPTPDTAHPNRTFPPWSTQETVDEEDEGEDSEGGEDVDEADRAAELDLDMLDAEGDHPLTVATSVRPAPTSDFQKHFWENRGDLNRKWRRRRKTAAKEKRYRDNRARADRAI
ncbi:uncharacterized protein B0I36DRAFT_311852 [Microdochium trichocladiopsis]|uniref:Uncharacterized protein n=1 Tax=Microdochium trichocladiopsis TaxID=1682393 RepID=A0A9P8YIM5_9PEZI|nr:uncharacterized protein B0I36DRAFT_311852 [Microdochium trichocladiopsis]KAH7040970.1 hypothetical protein B0I36DRAFT_311852 [Microdochium trichocladiopsis]